MPSERRARKTQYSELYPFVRSPRTSNELVPDFGLCRDESYSAGEGDKMPGPTVTASSQAPAQPLPTRATAARASAQQSRVSVVIDLTMDSDDDDEVVTRVYDTRKLFESSPDLSLMQQRRRDQDYPLQHTTPMLPLLHQLDMVMLSGQPDKLSKLPVDKQLNLLERNMRLCHAYQRSKTGSLLEIQLLRMKHTQKIVSQSLLKANKS